MLTHCFLQLSPSVFTVFYHYASGKYSTKKADGLTIYYILGEEIFLTVIFLFIYFIFFSIFIDIGSPASSVLPWILAGTFFALSLISLFFYFRKGKNTELFISRKLAKKITTNAKDVKTAFDAFVLGFTTCIPELIFTLPLFIAVALSLTYIINYPRSLLVFVYILVVVIPIFVYHHLYSTDHNLAEIERHRIKNKSFYRLIISLGFFILAFLLLNTGLGNG